MWNNLDYWLTATTQQWFRKRKKKSSQNKQTDSTFKLSCLHILTGTSSLFIQYFNWNLKFKYFEDCIFLKIILNPLFLITISLCTGTYIYLFTVKSYP